MAPTKAQINSLALDCLDCHDYTYIYTYDNSDGSVMKKIADNYVYYNINTLTLDGTHSFTRFGLLNITQIWNSRRNGIRFRFFRLCILGVFVFILNEYMHNHFCQGCRKGGNQKFVNRLCSRKKHCSMALKHKASNAIIVIKHLQ